MIGNSPAAPERTPSDVRTLDEPLVSESRGAPVAAGGHRANFDKKSFRDEKGVRFECENVSHRSFCPSGDRTDGKRR